MVPTIHSLYIFGILDICLDKIYFDNSLFFSSVSSIEGVQRAGLSRVFEVKAKRRGEDKGKVEWKKMWYTIYRIEKEDCLHI